MMRALALLGLLCSLAHAGDTPPPAMRDVPPASDATLALSLGGSPGGIGYYLVGVEARGRLRLGDAAELFASTGAYDFTVKDDENRGYERSLLANTNVGARGVLHASRTVTISTALSLWLPTATHGFPTELAGGTTFVTKEGIDSLRALRSPYAFADSDAAHLDLDVRWNVAPSWYLQTEAAAAAVHGELDDLTFAAGAGTTTARGVQVAAELRVVQEPTGVQYAGARAYAFAVAVGWPEDMPYPRLVISATTADDRHALVVSGELRVP